MILFKDVLEFFSIDPLQRFFPDLGPPDPRAAAVKELDLVPCGICRLEDFSCGHYPWKLRGTKIIFRLSLAKTSPELRSGASRAKLVHQKSLPAPQ